MRIMSTNFAKTLVWKHEYDIKLLRHKYRTPQTNDHHMSLNETPHEIFLRMPLSADGTAQRLDCLWLVPSLPELWSRISSNFGWLEPELVSKFFHIVEPEREIWVPI